MNKSKLLSEIAWAQHTNVICALHPLFVSDAIEPNKPIVARGKCCSVRFGRKEHGIQDDFGCDGVLFFLSIFFSCCLNLSSLSLVFVSRSAFLALTLVFGLFCLALLVSISCSSRPLRSLSKAQKKPCPNSNLEWDSQKRMLIIFTY